MRVSAEELRGRGPTSSEIFIETPQAKADSLGTFAVFVDFNDLPQTLRYLGALIAATGKRAYDDHANRNPEAAFGQALRAINAALAEDSRRGNAQWVGVLRAIVVAVSEGTIFLSQSLGCAAFLVRGGTVTDIPLESGEGSQPFGAMTIGTILPGDDIVIGTRTALTMRNAQASLARGVKQFSKLARRTEHFTCLHIAASFEESVRSPLALFTKPLHHLNLAIPSVLPTMDLRAPWLFPLAYLFSKAKKVRNATPLLRGAPQALPRALRSARHLPRLILRSSKPLPALLTPPPSPLITKRNVAIVTLTMVALLIIAATFAILPKRHTAPNLEASLATAREAGERGETQAILGNTEEALAAFEEGINALNAFESHPEASALRTELLTRRNAIGGIRTIEPKKIMSLSGFPVSLNANRMTILPLSDGKTGIALTGPQHPTVWLNSEREANGGTFLFLPPPLRGGVRDLASVNDHALLLVATTDGVAVIDPTKRKLLEANERSEARSIALLASNATHTFALLAQTGSLAALTIGEDGTITEKGWSRGEASLRETRDLTILHDDPLLLLRDNTFVRFRNGRRFGTYHIKGRGWNGTAQAFAALPDGRLLILDNENGRLLLTNERGDIEEQLEAPTFREGRELAIDAQGKGAYLLTSSDILFVPLEEK
jgi:hypothetical protein